MLNPRLDRRAPSRRAIAILAVLLLLVTLPVASLRARTGGPSSRAETTRDLTGGVSPGVQVVIVDANRTVPVTSSATVPVPVRRARTGGQAPLSGTIYDVTGGVMPGVEVTLVDLNETTWVATSNASGRFELPPVGLGKYTLYATLPGFRALRHEFELREARDWNRAVTLQVGDLTETITIRESRLGASTTQAPSTAGLQPVRVGGNVRPPRKVLDVRPVYPSSMREAGLTGVVPVEAIIGRDGTVSSVRVLSAQVHPDFAIAAIDAVRQWRFTPTLLNGVGVEVVMTVSVRFDLED